VHGTYCKSKQWHMHSLSLSLSLLKAQLSIGERTIHGAKKKFLQASLPTMCSTVLKRSLSSFQHRPLPTLWEV
jgi:hypothetical protein